MSDLVVNRLRNVIRGEQGGVSKVLNWEGGGDFAFFSFDKTKKEYNAARRTKVAPVKKVVYHQLNLFSLLDEYGENPIIENYVTNEELVPYGCQGNSEIPMIDNERNVLVSLVKKDNENIFLDGSAKIYYTGRRFPSTVALNKLYYFMPYLKGKGIRDIYVIRVVRIGYRGEGQSNENEKDLRLVFEIEFVKQLFEDYKSVELKIWRTFTDTTIDAIF